MDRVLYYATRLSKIADCNYEIQKELREKGFLAGKPYYDYWYSFCSNEEEKKELELCWKELSRERNGEYLDNKGRSVLINGSNSVHTIIKEWRKEAQEGKRPKEFTIAEKKEYQAMVSAKIIPEEAFNELYYKRACSIRDAFLLEVWGNIEPQKELKKLELLKTREERYDFLNHYFLLAVDGFVKKFSAKGFDFDSKAAEKYNTYGVRKLLNDNKTVIACILDTRGIGMVDSGMNAWANSSSIDVSIYVSQEKNANTVILSEKNIRAKFRKIHPPLYDYVGYSHYFSAADLERCLDFWVTLAEIEIPYVEKVLS